MTPGRKTVAAFLTVICGLVLAAVDLYGGWPAWTWLPVAALVVVAPWLLTALTGRRTNPVPPELVPHLPVAPVERRDQRVTQVVLPSLWEDYDFLFTATVRWCPSGRAAGEPVINPAGLAIDAILARARSVTEKREPNRASLVQHELNGVLGRMRPDDTGYLQVMADGVVLTLPEADQKRLTKLAAVRKDEAVWEHERKYEQSKRDYLGEDVLKDTGSAVVWWLSRNDDQVEKTVGDIGLLTQLASAARNEDVPPRYRHLVPELSGHSGTDAGDWNGGDDEEAQDGSAADLFADFLEAQGIGEDDPRRELLVDRMAEALDTGGDPEAAEELRRRFDATEPEKDDDAPEDGEAAAGEWESPRPEGAAAE
ncbi:hypothetical protein ACWERV_23940 [Streptomyces sp. NPDC004031]